MTEKEKENRIHSFALSFLERQQIVPNLYADQIIRGYKEGYHQAEKDLEVKEVDVEKESELIANSIMISVQANLYHTNVYDYEKRCYKHSDLKDAARKGIELSLKAQKGE